MDAAFLPAAMPAKIRLYCIALDGQRREWTMTGTTERAVGDVRQANTRTVDALQRVYGMVIALALTTAVKVVIEAVGLIAPKPQTGAETSQTAVLFGAFLMTLVVFYHGMNRHLDDTFVIGENAVESRLPLLVDIFVFLLEGALLVAMAYAIPAPETFLHVWTGLLAIDILWGLYVYVIVERTAPAKWVLNNAIFLAAAWVVWLRIAPGQAIALGTVEMLRSVVDYRINWSFYFPRRGVAGKAEVVRGIGP